MRTLIVLFFATLMVGCGVTASSRNPGYVQFDMSEHIGLKSDTSISLGPHLLRFAARHMEDEPQTKALLKSLDGVRVSVYQVAESADQDALRDEVDITAANAFDERWSPIVRVVDNDSRVHIFVQERDGVLLGIAVVALDSRELVFVNVMGEIAAENLFALSSVVPGTDSLVMDTIAAE